MIKNLLAFFPMLFLSVVSYGQLQKGTGMLGGAVGFSSNSNTFDSGNGNDSKTNSFTFSPNIGYFVKDNWMVGLNTNLYWSNQTIDFDSDVASQDFSAEISTREVGVEPFVRKYFPLGEQLSFFGQLGAGVNTTIVKTDYQGSGAPANPAEEETVNSFQVSTEIGLAFFPKPWLGIELSFVPFRYRNYIQDVSRPQSETNYESDYFEFGVNTSALQLGVNFFFSKK